MRIAKILWHNQQICDVFFWQVNAIDLHLIKKPIKILLSAKIMNEINEKEDFSRRSCIAHAVSIAQTLVVL